MKNIVTTTAQGSKSPVAINYSKTEAYFLNEKITKEKMMHEILEFEKIAFQALKKLLCMPISDFREISNSKVKLDYSYPVIFHGEFVRCETKNSRYRFVFGLAKTEVIRLTANFGIGGPRSECYLDHPNEDILKLGYEEQVDIAEKCIGKDIHSLLQILREKRRFFTFYLPNLGQLLEEEENCESFISSLIKMASTGKQPIGSKSKEYLLWCFLAFLRKSNIILLPTQNYRINLFEDDYHEILSSHIFDQNKLEIIDAIKKSESNFTHIRARIAQVLFLSSSFQHSGDVQLSQLTGIVGNVFSVSESKSNKEKLQSHARAIYDEIANIWNKDPNNKKIKTDERFIPTSNIPKETNIVNELGNEKKDPFWFVFIDNLTYKHHHPLRHYKRNETIIGWAEILRSTFSLLKIKSTARYRAAGRAWLAYIHSLENQPKSLPELNRFLHINDILPNGSYTFRKYLNERDIDNNSKQEILSGLQTIFDLYIRANDLNIKNPIDIVIDGYATVKPRGKTPRTPLSPEMLEYIKEFNSRGNFGFSKTFEPRSYSSDRVGMAGHYREVKDDSGKNVRVWWPVLPVLIDLLLTIPLRGFQGRWLDSGEGDEFQLDPFTLEEVINESELKIKKRQAGVFIKFDGSMQTREDFLGLRISTNKRLVDEDGEYDIPWCPDNIRDHISMVIDWQKKYNKIDAPVVAEESTIDDYRAAEVDTLLPRVFPIFRDPLNQFGRPPTYQQVSTYWSQLCAAVEDELREKEGTKFRLTRDRVHNGVVQHLALFDLHTLRVSGITALIEAGLPPSMVQEIVGHATVIMTLYYNKVHPGVVNEKIIESILSMELSMDKIPEVTTQFSEYQKFLINSRDEGDRPGVDFLKSAIGNGSYQILSHSICPGGDCRTGGKYCNLKKEHAPVPRAGACSLCRYRFTGPMFLVGLVNNANKIMGELFAKGQTLAALNDEIRKVKREGKSTMLYESKREACHRETENLWSEWAAEVKYIKTCSDQLAEYLEVNGKGNDVSLIGHADAIASITARPERHHHFYLHQSLSKASAYNPADINSDAINNRDLFLNELLANNDMDPFLLKLSKETRLKAGNLLGDLLLENVPEGDLQELHNGSLSIKTFIKLEKAYKKIAKEAISSSENFELTHS